MPDSQQRADTGLIVRVLTDNAIQALGPQRTASLRAAIESTAANIASLRNDLPSLAEEPGFYFQ